MADNIAAREGPWVDEEGRDCLGTWADEGGVLVILRRDSEHQISFHVMNTAGLPHLGGGTLSSFRWERVRKFLEAAQ